MIIIIVSIVIIQDDSDPARYIHLALGIPKQSHPQPFCATSMLPVSLVDPCINTWPLERSASSKAVVNITVSGVEALTNLDVA